MADGVAASFDPAVVALDGLVPVEQARRWVGVEGFDLLDHGRPVGLQRQEIVAAAGADGGRDRCLGTDGVDRHQGALQRQPFQQERK